MECYEKQKMFTFFIQKWDPRLYMNGVLEKKPRSGAPNFLILK